jgi:hypothetical protein
LVAVAMRCTDAFGRDDLVGPHHQRGLRSTSNTQYW